MQVKNFRLLVGLQVALILALGALFVWLLTATTLRMSAALVGVAVILAVASLIHTVDETNRKLARFMLAIEHTDTSQTFSSEGHGRSFDELAATLQSVFQRFRESRSAYEEQAIFLRTLVQHVPVPLLAIRSDGRVTLFNNAARRLLGPAQPHHLQNCETLGQRFVDAVLHLEPGQHQTLPVYRDGERLHLNLSATLLRQRGRDEKLVCIQDISSELDARELDAFQKLMRVLTHEVMNSITPITSLAETAAQQVATLRSEPNAPDELDDLLAAVSTIGRRSHGLTRFVHSYRQMTRLPEPEIEACSVTQLLSRTRYLMQEAITLRKARVTVDVDPTSLEIHADPELIEQALINLLRNALEAVPEDRKPVVQLGAQVVRSGQVVVTVTDNGVGLSEDARRHLFVPFFTTKAGGSGVGMSIVRQIMRLHGGTVGVESRQGDSDDLGTVGTVGTVVSLRF